MVWVVARLRAWRSRRLSRLPYPDAAVPIDDGAPTRYAVHQRVPQWAVEPTRRLPLVASRPLLTRAARWRSDHAARWRRPWR